MDQNATQYFPTIRQLADYEVWCNGRSLQAAAPLTHAHLHQQFSFGLKTIHKTLSNMLGVFGYWTGFISPVIVDDWRWDYDPAISIETMSRMSEELSSVFLTAIDASHAAGLLAKDRRLVQLFHLVTHGTHHRTQFISMLRILGMEPPFEAGDFAGWQRI